MGHLNHCLISKLLVHLGFDQPQCTLPVLGVYRVVWHVEGGGTLLYRVLLSSFTMVKF